MSLLARLNATIGPSQDARQTVPYWLQTPLPNLNVVLSDRIDGGFPGGRLTTIAGPSSSGKTALATQAMISAQRHVEGFAAFFDHEHAFELHHAIRQGLDEDRFYYRKPRVGEEMFDSLVDVMRMVRSEQIGYDYAKIDGKDNAGHLKFLDAVAKYGIEKLPPLIAVVDSIAAITPAEQDRKYSDQNMKSKNMALAALLSLELKRIAARDCNCTGTTLIMLNQLRKNPNIMFGDNNDETGGEAAPFYASIRLATRRAGKVFAEWDNDKSLQVGDIVEVKTKKNKVAPPFRKTKYVFRTVDPVGIDLPATMVLLGKEAKCLGPEGGKTIEFGGKKRWNIDEFLTEARGNPALVADLVKHVMPVIMPSLAAEHSVTAAA